MLKNILASLLHIYRACFVSSKIKERTLIYRASFILHQGLKIEIHYTFIPSASFVSSLLKERGMLHIHSACFVSRWFKEGDILQKLYLTKIDLFLCALHLIKFGRHDLAFWVT